MMEERESEVQCLSLGEEDNGGKRMMNTTVVMRLVLRLAPAFKLFTSREVNKNNISTKLSSPFLSFLDLFNIFNS